MNRRNFIKGSFGSLFLAKFGIIECVAAPIATQLPKSFEGGYIVPIEIADMIEKALLKNDGIRFISKQVQKEIDYDIKNFTRD